MVTVVVTVGEGDDVVGDVVVGEGEVVVGVVAVGEGEVVAGDVVVGVVVGGALGRVA